MLRIVISFAPFMVCLFWLVVFALGYGRHNPSKKVLTWFLLACTVLYLCHALFFNRGISYSLECIWALCSLSVYPIYYLYIRALTGDFYGNISQFWVLVPGLAVTFLLVFFPGKASDMVRAVVAIVQIVLVCKYGVGRLRDFDRLVASCYANVEGRDTTDVKNLLIPLVATSALSASANILGKSFFADDDRLLLLVALLFAFMLFSLSYIGYTRDFSYMELSIETEDADAAEMLPEPDEDLGRRLDALMKEKKYYRETGLTINDVAVQIGSCRTYVSNYINRVKGGSFSDYINGLRVEDAKTILKQDGNIKNYAIAEILGFANEQSFYRNFKKITGMTPAQWRKEGKGL